MEQILTRWEFVLVCLSAKQNSHQSEKYEIENIECVFLDRANSDEEYEKRKKRREIERNIEQMKKISDREKRDEEYEKRRDERGHGAVRGRGPNMYDR